MLIGDAHGCNRRQRVDTDEVPTRMSKNDIIIDPRHNPCIPKNARFPVPIHRTKPAGEIPGNRYL